MLYNLLLLPQKIIVLDPNFSPNASINLAAFSAEICFAKLSHQNWFSPSFWVYPTITRIKTQHQRRFIDIFFFRVLPILLRMVFAL